MVERLTLSAFSAFAKTFLRSRPPSPPPSTLLSRDFFLTHRWSSCHLCRHAIINRIIWCQDRESESLWLCGASTAWLGKVIALLHGLPTASCIFPTADAWALVRSHIHCADGNCDIEDWQNETRPAHQENNIWKLFTSSLSANKFIPRIFPVSEASSSWLELGYRRSNG